MKVLVVDDDPRIVESLVTLINLMGEFDPIPASSAQLALNLISNGGIYLVLTDYSMPQMDGVALIAKIREINPLIECIMMTAHEDKEILIQALRAGARDFIRKPFDINDIELALKNAVARLQMIPSLKEIESRQIARAVSICKTDREAAAKLGINYTTLSRNKKRVLNREK